jgi:osmoprotectant transport system substrate-binding protein
VPRRWLGLLAAVAVALAGCGGSDHKTATATSGKPVITLGVKNFTEEFVLGQLYKQALEARGFRVDLKNDIGSSEIVDRALTSGAIDMYPEYTGVIVQEIAHEKTLPRTAQQTYRRAKSFEAGRGFAVLDPSPGQDVLANAVRPQFARKHNLKTTADLRGIGPFTYGGPAENRTRFQGVVGMRKVYKLFNLRYVPLNIEDRYKALGAGKVDMVGAFTTDPELRDTSKVRVLSDPAGIFGFQNIVPVVKRSVLAREGPKFARTLNELSAKLTSRELRELNAQVVLDHRSPADVAHDFLRRNPLP